MAAYEVLLLNTAIPQIQAAQSGDTYVCPRDIAFSAALTLSAGTANGVPYLNGSKVLTSGSALTYNGTGLGVGSANPGRLLVLDGGASGPTLQMTNTAAGSSAGNGLEITFDGTNTFINNRPNGYMWFGVNATEGMRLTSTGLGIGTNNPGTKLHVNDLTADSYKAINVTAGGGGADAGIRLSGAGGNAFRIQQPNTSAGLLFYDETNGATRMTISASGNLGLGVTPSAWATVLPVLQANNASFTGFNNQALLSSNYYYNAGNKYIANGYASQYSQSSGQHIWYTAANNTSGAGAALTFTQAMTLDASGNLLLGLTSGTAKFDMAAGSGSQTAIRVRSLSTNSNGFNIVTDSTTDNIYLNNFYNAAMLFGTNNTERARITSGGYFKASNDGTYFDATGAHHELRQSASVDTVFITNANASPTNMSVITSRYTGASPNNTTTYFLYCSDGGSTARANIRTNGGLANYQSNNVDLSDIRTKTDISPLASYWNKIAALEIVTYKYKDQTHDDLNIGVIAQQVEQVAPEFVDADGFGETPEDGVPLKTIYNKDLTFAAIKALQEAMARIEQLEAKVAAMGA